MRPLVAIVLVGLTATSFAGCVGDAPPAGDSAAPPQVPDAEQAGHELIVPTAPGFVERAQQPKFSLTGIGFGAFEPTMGVTSTNTLFFIAGTNVLRSRDYGLTWENVAPNAGGQNVPPTTLDPMLWVDPVTDRVFYNHLYLACTYMAYSDDEGATWIPNPIACGHPVADHQTLASGPAMVPAPLYENRAVYLCVNMLADATCSVSLDGGASFLPGRNVFLEAKVAQCGGITGHVRVGPDGTVYIPSWQCDEAWIGISRDGGLNWDAIRIAPSLSSGAMDPVVAIDTSNNAYYFWMDLDGVPYLTMSTDGGMSWREPIPIAFDGLVTATLPTIVAGDAGRIAMSYVATTTGNAVNAAEVDSGEPWNLYVTMSLDALSENPHFTTVQLNSLGDPVHTGPCSGGYRCGSIVDFFDITMGPDGRVYVASVDSEDDGEGILGMLLEGPSLLESVGDLTDPIAGGA